MSAPFDDTDFIDPDFHATHKASAATTIATGAPGLTVTPRPPTREELEAKTTQAHQKIFELKRAQEDLERERAALEEARRRRHEFQVGREEMLRHLTRGVGLLAETELKARQDAESMARTLADFREALGKVEAIQEEHWTADNWQTELTKALTTIENARMEWTSARVKLPVLNGAVAPADTPPAPAARPAGSDLAELRFGRLCRLGFAFTWPLALAALLTGAALVAVLLLRR